MNLTFRQGIARFQSDAYFAPEFLMKSGDYVDLIVSPDPTIVVFAHRDATYVIQENKTVRNAWGPFTGNTTQYLYWDINLLDASLTRGFTSQAPIVSNSAPTTPGVDQHWYDTNISQMKVWNGNKWVDKLRVFAAIYSSSAIIQFYPLGSQVGEVGSFAGGSIVLDSKFKPLRQSNGTFVTSATNLTLVNTSTQQISLTSTGVGGMAEENIPKFSLVQKANTNLTLARSTELTSRVVGMVTEDLFKSEVGYFQTTGIVTNEQWNWPTSKFGQPVFCGPTGEAVLNPPSTGTMQIVGYVYDKTSIFLNIQAPVVVGNTSVSPELKIVCVSPNGEFATIPADGIGAGPGAGQGNGNGNVFGFEHQQTAPSAAWTINHGKDTRRVHVTIWDAADEQIIAGVVKVVNANTVSIKFNTAMTGRAVLMLF